MPNIDVPIYSSGRFSKRDFSNCEILTSRNSLQFTECTNLPKNIIVTGVVTFRNCHFTYMPTVLAHEINFNSVTGFSSLDLDAFKQTDKFKQTILTGISFRRCHDLERITGSSSTPLRFLRVESCRNFTTISPKSTFQLNIEHCQKLSSPIKAPFVTLLNCKGEDDFTIEFERVAGVHRFKCKNLTLNTYGERATTGVAVSGVSHIQKIKTNAKRVEIEHSRLRKLEVAEETAQLRITCPNLTTFCPPEKYESLELINTKVKVPPPLAAKHKLFISTPHPAQENYLILRDKPNGGNLVYMVRPKVGEPVCRIRYDFFPENTALTLAEVKKLDRNNAPGCLFYKNRLRRKIELFLRS